MADRNSTGLAFSTVTWVMVPLASALISFMTFMASMMQTTFPRSPRSQFQRIGADSGEGER